MDTSTFNSQSASSHSSATQQSPTTSSTMPVPAPAPIGAPSTDAFLKDFTLVAEAAKRAQVAVMVRDFESIGL